MKKNNFIFNLSIIAFMMLIFIGCIEKRSKKILTDIDGKGESNISIIQNAEISFINYSSGRLNCGSQLKILITVFEKEIVKDNFVFVEKSEIIENLKQIYIKEGDLITIKLENGCPKDEYTINYRLDNEK